MFSGQTFMTKWPACVQMCNINFYAIHSFYLPPLDLFQFLCPSCCIFMNKQDVKRVEYPFFSEGYPLQNVKGLCITSCFKNV